MKIHLKKAIIHKGNELQTLDLDLDSLTGNDLIAAEDEIFNSKGNSLHGTDLSSVRPITIAAKALHMPVEILKQMCARDFARVVNEVRNFLFVSDSKEEQTDEAENQPEKSSDESQ